MERRENQEKGTGKSFTFGVIINFNRSNGPELRHQPGSLEAWKPMLSRTRLSFLLPFMLLVTERVGRTYVRNLLTPRGGVQMDT